jgi:hypothetical protein
MRMTCPELIDLDSNEEKIKIESEQARKVL